MRPGQQPDQKPRPVAASAGPRPHASTTWASAQDNVQRVPAKRKRAEETEALVEKLELALEVSENVEDSVALVLEFSFPESLGQHTRGRKRARILRALAKLRADLAQEQVYLEDTLRGLEGDQPPHGQPLQLVCHEFAPHLLCLRGILGDAIDLLNRLCRPEVLVEIEKSATARYELKLLITWGKAERAGLWRELPAISLGNAGMTAYWDRYADGAESRQGKTVVGEANSTTEPSAEAKKDQRRVRFK
ncbi:uncharacterized protein MAM_06269 [Metarhizium album ARSEF 1941]|uniref:Uncharacterized protein n=1 Tax=Metarhizium album (strain ARSEF 1941) TaxID=1081103 RepID=A0A0B2WQY5_METAS|nr:uncharacterized protein MAM_06269 [Metarhizium album ARSEF 1941]KHN95907.1 hypothetical protein MAM_06269 [Metarhizium album ARSEF 1941]